VPLLAYVFSGSVATELKVSGEIVHAFRSYDYQDTMCQK